MGDDVDFRGVDTKHILERFAAGFRDGNQGIGKAHGGPYAAAPGEFLDRVAHAFGYGAGHTVNGHHGGASHGDEWAGVGAVVHQLSGDGFLQCRVLFHERGDGCFGVVRKRVHFPPIFLNAFRNSAGVRGIATNISF